MSIIPKKKKWRFLLGAIIIAVIAIFATSNGSSPFDKNIQTVQNGHLEAIPDQKIGPAFKEFSVSRNGPLLRRLTIKKL